MPLTLGPSDDLMYDNLEVLVFTSVLPSGNVQVTVASAKALAISRREVSASGGYFDGSELVCWLRKSQMQGIVPKEGDSITRPDGTVWMLSEEIRTVVFGTAYRVVGKKAR